MSAHRTLNDLFRAFDAVGPGHIEDPGDAGTITVSQWAQICSVVTAGASEARILDAPTKAGILCAVVHDTDGGDFTLTVNPTSGTCYGYNQDNDTTIAFAHAGDYAVFYSVKMGSEYAWRAIAQEGTTASTEDLSIDSLTFGGHTVAFDDMAAGTGISSVSSAVCEHSVTRVGSLIKTEILIDLDGLHGGGTAGDIIGKDGGTANCHIGAIDADVNGTIIAGRVSCLEVPAGGDPDIDIWGTCTEATGAQDAAISGLTDEAQLINHGDWAAGAIDELEAMPGEGYLYLTNGTATDAEYTTGILLIELWGTA